MYNAIQMLTRSEIVQIIFTVDNYTFERMRWFIRRVSRHIISLSLDISQFAYAIERHKFLNKSTMTVYEREYVPRTQRLSYPRVTRALSSTVTQHERETINCSDEKKLSPVDV